MVYLSVDPRLGEGTPKEFPQPLMLKDYFLDLADKFRSIHLWLRHGEAGDPVTKPYDCLKYLVEMGRLGMELLTQLLIAVHSDRSTL